MLDASTATSVGEFAELVGQTPANVAVLKNGRATAVRLSTLEAVCRVLECEPGDLLELVVDDKTAYTRQSIIWPFVQEGTRYSAMTTSS